MAAENLTRRCCDCHWYLPLTCFSVHVRPDRGGKSYFSSRCKDCAKLAAHVNYHGRREDALKVKLQWRLANKAHIVKANRAYRENNEELIRKQKAAYYQRPEVKQRRLEQNRTARHADPQRANYYSAKWRKEHPETRRVSSKNNKAKRRLAPGTCTPRQWLDKCDYFGWLCYLCKIPVSSATVHLEHRTPLSRGGSQWPANLAPACEKCNLAKNNKTEAEYRAIMK